MPNPNDIRTRMDATGIGLAGIEGTWWLPAVEPFTLPDECHSQLQNVLLATFALFDAVGDLYGTAEGDVCGLNSLLRYKVPSHLGMWASKQPVLAVRPDFQLVPQQTSGVSLRAKELTLNEVKTPEVLSYAFVATELEICPSAHGFAHAMQVGYGLEPDLIKAYAQFLNGRELLIVCTHAWSEFIWDQVAFCAALISMGGRARLLFDLPIETLTQQVRQKQRWVPPMFGIPTQPATWKDDVLGRIAASGVPVAHLSSAQDISPGNSVVFRFGYLDCFSAEVLQQLNDWERQGAPFLNPTSFVWDSKVMLAAARMPQVRAKIGDKNILATLDRCIPETHLLLPELLPQLQRQRSDWVLKFAGFDSGQQAWGGRSLQWGTLHNDESWAEVLQHYLDLPFPVVAQRRTMSELYQIAFFDQKNRATTSGVRAMNTRLRSFFLRNTAHTGAYGTHMTFAHGSVVSEDMQAVQAPVQFLP